MPKQKPPRLRMVVIESDGTKSPVHPFNRDTQELRKREVRSFGQLHPLRI